MTSAPSEIQRMLADRSFMAAVWHEVVLNVLRSHQETGDPVVVWRDGKVVHLDQQEIARRIDELAREDTASPPEAA